MWSSGPQRNSNAQPRSETSRESAVQPGPSFAVLLARAQRGDEDAFAVIWRTANPILLRYLTLRAPEVAADIASEAWVPVLRDLRVFRGGEGQFRTWLFEIARSRAKNWHRKQARQPLLRLDDQDLQPWTIAVTGTEDI